MTRLNIDLERIPKPMPILYHILHRLARDSISVTLSYRTKLFGRDTLGDTHPPKYGLGTIGGLYYSNLHIRRAVLEIGG